MSLTREGESQPRRSPATPRPTPPPEEPQPAFELRVAGSLGLSGKDSSIALSALKGLQLLEEYINNGTFNNGTGLTTNNGSKISVRIDIKDDHSNADNVRKIYRKLAESEDVDALLGPYTSGLADVAAEAVYQYFAEETLPDKRGLVPRDLRADTCDEASWPDKKNDMNCGGCKVLVNRFRDLYKTCNNYCATVGRKCSGAWEEASDSCSAIHGIGCNQTLDSTDALCECKEADVGANKVCAGGRVVRSASYRDADTQELVVCGDVEDRCNSGLGLCGPIKGLNVFLWNSTPCCTEVPAIGGTCGDPDPAKMSQREYMCPSGYITKSPVKPNGACTDVVTCIANCCEETPTAAPTFAPPTSAPTQAPCTSTSECPSEYTCVSGICEPRFVEGNEASQCPIGYGGILLELDCLSAASHSGRNLSRSESNADWPRGCYRYRDGNVFWSPGLDQPQRKANLNADVSPICQQACSSWVTLESCLLVAFCVWSGSVCEACEIDVGAAVVVVDNRWLYSSSELQAHALNLESWVRGLSLSNGIIGRVINIHDNVVGFRDDATGYDYAIGRNGLHCQGCYDDADGLNIAVGGTAWSCEFYKLNQEACGRTTDNGAVPENYCRVSCQKCGVPTQSPTTTPTAEPTQAPTPPPTAEVPCAATRDCESAGLPGWYSCYTDIGKCKAEYMTGTRNANVCPVGFTRIRSRIECFMAAAMLEEPWGRDHEYNHSWGCWLSSAGNIYWYRSSVSEERGAGKPVCKKAEFLMTAEGTNVCPAGSIKIDSESECRLAALAVGKGWNPKDSKWQGAREDRPGGCWFGSRNANFNPSSVSTASANSALICQKFPTPTQSPTKSPTQMPTTQAPTEANQPYELVASDVHCSGNSTLQGKFLGAASSTQACANLVHADSDCGAYFSYKKGHVPMMAIDPCTCMRLGSVCTLAASASGLSIYEVVKAKATCGDADGISGPGTAAVSCPSGYWARSGVLSTKCANATCDTSTASSADTNTCCKIRSAIEGGCHTITDRSACCQHTDGRTWASSGSFCVPAMVGRVFTSGNVCEPECWTNGTCGNAVHQGNRIGICQISIVGDKEQDFIKPKVMMNFGAAATTNYQKGFSYLFTVNTMATEYFAAGLYAFKATGAKTLSIATGAGPFAADLELGVLFHANRLGYTIDRQISIWGESDITDQVRILRLADSDVLVICGQFADTMLMTVTARSLQFNPRAMIGTMAVTPTFMETVGPANVVYLTSPVVWDGAMTDANHLCPIFGTPARFEQLFEERFGEKPSYQSALAAGAVITLLLAAQGLGAAGPADMLREEILKMDDSSLIGLLHFSQNGTRSNGMYTAKGDGTMFHGTRSVALAPIKQFKPVHNKSVAGAPAKRSVLPVLITQEEYPFYPLPSWEQRELLLYPCPPGSIVKRLASAEEGEIICKPCGVGRFRSNQTLGCRDCGNGFYGDARGLASCHECIDGMDCSASKVDGEPDAQAGWYALRNANNTLQYFECTPHEICLGANKCLGENTGVKCAQCKLGYTNTGMDDRFSPRLHICQKCPSKGYSALIASVVFFIYCAFVAVFRSFSSLSAVSLMSLHSVIIKIIMNYTIFASTVLEATGYKYSLGIRLGADFVLNPLQSWIDFDCMVGQHMRPYEGSIILGLTLIPLTVFGVYLWFMLIVPLAQCTRDFIVRKLGIRDRNSENDRQASKEFQIFASAYSKHLIRSMSGSALQTNQRGSSAASVGTNATSSRHSDPSESHFSIGATTVQTLGVAESVIQAKDEDSQPSDDLSDEQEGEMVGLDSDGSLHLHHPDWHTATDNMEEVIQELETQRIQAVIIWVFVLHPMVVQMLLRGCHCVEVDVLRLKHDLDATCGEMGGWLWLSLMGVVLYGAGIPALVFYMLHRIRKRLLDVHVRRRYCFLYNGFEDKFYYFEVFNMMRKVMVLIAMAVPDKYVRMMTMMTLGFFFVAIHVRWQPWDNRSFFMLDKLETLSLLSFILPLASKLVHDLGSTLPNKKEPFLQFLKGPIFLWLTSGLCGLVHAAFLATALYGLFRTTVIKHLFLQHEYCPESLGCISKFLIRLEKHRHSPVILTKKTHALDLSLLCDAEREFLYVALCDTLGYYMQANRAGLPKSIKDGKHEHPRLFLGFLTAAIRIAFKRFRDMREHMREKVLERHNKTLGTWRNSALWQSIVWGMGDTGHWTLSHRLHGGALSSVGLGTMTNMDEGVIHHPDERNAYPSVEDLQVALMLSWHDIAQGKERYFKITRHEALLATEDDSRSALSTAEWKPDVSLGALLSEIYKRQGGFKGTKNEHRTKLTADEFEAVKKELGLERVIHATETPVNEQSVDTFSNNNCTEPMTPNTARENNVREKHERMLSQVLEMHQEVATLRRRLAARGQSAEQARSAISPPTLGSAVPPHDMISALGSENMHQISAASKEEEEEEKGDGLAEVPSSKLPELSGQPPIAAEHVVPILPVDQDVSFSEQPNGMMLMNNSALRTASCLSCGGVGCGICVLKETDEGVQGVMRAPQARRRPPPIQGGVSGLMA